MMEREQLVCIYFYMGLSYKEILEYMAYIHNDVFSLRTLKRLLKRRSLFRRKNMSDLVDVANFIVEQYETNGQLHGYRWMHQKCLQHGLIVPQNTVRLLLLALFPDIVDMRRRRRLQRRRYECAGPNAVWHVDGYDKLKHYGVFIHGCIDGFSRQIIWLKAAYTNKHPGVVAGKNTV